MNNVVHLVRWCLPHTASFIRNQIIYHQRYRPSVVYTQPKKGNFYEDIHAKAETLFPLRSSFDRKLYGFTKLLSPAAKILIREFIKRQKPAVLHIHYGVDCLVYADIIRELQIPACVSFYGYDCTTFPKRFLGVGKLLLQKRVFDNPSVKAVFAMSDDMKRDLIKIGCPEEKLIVHYYGIETDPFFMDRSIAANEVIKFLMVSGLHEKKGHQYLIEAFANLSHTLHNKCELHIVGDGPLYVSIKDGVAKSNLTNIFLHAAVTYGSPEHKAYLRDADIFVHPSITSHDGDKEGIPGALIEAMAAGLPVISSFHAGIPSVVENEITGLLVPEKDAKALEAAMLRLATDTVLRARIGRQGQQYALEQLDVSFKEKELEEIYDLISKTKKSINTVGDFS